MIDGGRAALRGLLKGVTHAGLLLDKALIGQKGEQDEARAKRALCLAATDVEVPPTYEQAFKRRRALLETFDGGIRGGVTRLRRAATSGRIVVGLGAASVRETSIALLRTWGVPYLPGSALKGVASAAAHGSGLEAWRKKTSEAPAGVDHAILFGETGDVGCVTFHDAWWIPTGRKLPLDVDTITTHHREYYAGADVPPADSDSPVPVPFLTARGEFLVALSGPEAWVAAASEWLAIGLAERGIGAKTSAGYGRTSLVREMTKAEEAQERARGEIEQAVGQFKGATNARLVFDRIVSFYGKDPEWVAEGLRMLYELDPEFWKAWLEKAATAEQKALAERLEMTSPRRLAVLASPRDVEPKHADMRWEPGGAWIAREKNRTKLFFLGDQKRDERWCKDLTIEGDDLEDALLSAGAKAAVAVEVQRDAKKIVRVRRKAST